MEVQETNWKNETVKVATVFRSVKRTFLSCKNNLEQLQEVYIF